MNRIDSKFRELKAANKKGLVIFITAGAPDIETTIAAVKMAEANGADAIELGIPFSDPMADGPIIQRSSFEAIKKGMTVPKLVDLVRKIRSFTNIPLLAMGYLNNLLNYGLAEFFADAKEAGLDGLILPDVPHEESAELRRLGMNSIFPSWSLSLRERFPAVFPKSAPTQKALYIVYPLMVLPASGKLTTALLERWPGR